MIESKEEEKQALRKQFLETGELEKGLLRSIYSKSYYEFFKEAYKVLLPGEHYSDNWHVKYLCNRLQEEQERITRRELRLRDLIINIPFRSAKSLICTVVFPAWCWINDQSLKFICVSYSAQLALEHAQLSRTLISSEFYQTLFGDKVIFEGDQNAVGFYKILGGGYRKSVGTGGQITGSGSDIIISDDAQNPSQAASEVERRNTKSFYDTTLYSRLNQPELGVRINIQQRLHEEDLTGHLIGKAKDKHEHICIPVKINLNDLKEEKFLSPKSLVKYYSKTGHFWEDRFSDKVIDDYTVTLGEMAVAGQLYQRPAPMEGNMVKREWFDIVDPLTIERDLRLNPMCFFIDTAESEKQKESGDYTAIVTAFKKNNCVYICNVARLKKPFYELVDHIPTYVKDNMYSEHSMIYIEPKSSGKSVVSQLRATTQLNVIELRMPTNDQGRQNDKITRMSMITPPCNSRRVKFLQGLYLHDFMDNLLVFPNGKHDDDVDAFIHCVNQMLNVSNFDWVEIG